jgi:hypothetical protein
MAQITSYATLKTEVANWLNRSDLSSDAGTFVQLAEQSFERDERCRKLADRGTFNITADGDTLPSDFDSMEAWYHNGASSFYGEIEIVPAEIVQRYNRQFGPTGTPAVAAITEGVVRYGPAPDATYATLMTYWRKIVPLSDSQTDNWLLLDSPDIYLYGALVEAEPFLKNDPRMALWQAKLERALNMLAEETQRKQLSGTMVRRPKSAIGG